jgi:hypothetical protein
MSTDWEGDAPHAVLATRIAATRRENGSRSFIMDVQEVIEWKIRKEGVAMASHPVELGEREGQGNRVSSCHGTRVRELENRYATYPYRCYQNSERILVFSPFGREARYGWR